MSSLKRTLGEWTRRMTGRTVTSNLKTEPGTPGLAHGDTVMVDRLSAFLPWEAADDDGFFILRGSRPDEAEGLGFTIEIMPQTGVTEDMQRSLLGLTSGLPPGATLSVTAYASPAVEGLAEAMLPPEPRPDPFPPLSGNARRLLCESAKNRAAAVCRGARVQMTPAAPVVVRHWRVWLSVVLPGADPTNRELREQAETARRSIRAVLEQSALYQGDWNAQILVGTAAEILNPQAVRAMSFVRPSANPFEAPSAQVMLPDTEVTVERHRIRFESAESRETAASVSAVGLSVETYPERGWSLAEASGLLGETGRGGAQIPCPFLFTMILSLLDSASERVKAEGHRMRALQMSQTPLSQLSPFYHEKVRQWGTAVKSFQNEGGLACVTHQLLLLVPAGEEAEAVNAAQTIARKVGAELRRTTCLHGLSLLAALPMAAGPLLAADLRRCGRLERRTLATGLFGAPIMTEWQGNGPRDDRTERTPLLTLLGRRGQVFHVDPFSNVNGSYSATIVGKPGSGKSVVMNMLAVNVLAQGGLVFVIDVGRSYEKTAKLLDGEFLIFDAENVWDLNPFMLLGLLAGEDREEGIESIVAILGELLSPGAPLPDLQRSVLISAVADAGITAAKEGRTATLSDLDAALERFARTDRRLDDLRLQLAPYLTGPLSKWFDGSGRPVDFRSRLTVLELEGLSAHPALRQAVLMTLMLFIERTMAQDRSTVKLVLIDEAWDLMGSGHSGKFIASGFRRARKHKGGFVVATQSLADFFMSETAEAAWQCADTRITLRQDPETLAAVEAAGKFVADDWFRAALPSLTTVRGAWSEMIVRVGDAPPAVGRLVLDRFTQVLFSSLPAEFTAVNAWRAAGADMATAVSAVADGLFKPDPALIAAARQTGGDR